METSVVLRNILRSLGGRLGLRVLIAAWFGSAFQWASPVAWCGSASVRLGGESFGGGTLLRERNPLYHTLGWAEE
jgi:hypothetical protein